jgi:membrane protease YdiL (CAAX protease family)
MAPATAGKGPSPENLTELLPLGQLDDTSAIETFLNYPPVRALVPVVLLAIVLPPVFWFFRGVWRDVDAETARLRLEREARGEVDYRPFACFVIVAVVLTLQEYFGGRSFFDQAIRPELHALFPAGTPGRLKLDLYDEFFGFAWWVGARVAGYMLVPLALWKLLFPKDKLLDLGFRVRGFFDHIWIYLGCLAIVALVVLAIATQPDFGTYYPFYKASSRSWFDFLCWELIYFAQFFALEAFFRGWILNALRPSLGSAAIFAMALPYCMIHYGKPYLEANGAIVAGIVLGSLAIRTRSIYAGFFVHITVAFMMDFLALLRREALPTSFWPTP